MNTSQIADSDVNPIAIADDLYELSPEELAKTLRAAFDEALQVSVFDDEVLCARLNESDRVAYEPLMSVFKEAFNKVTKLQKVMGDAMFTHHTAIPLMSPLVARCRAVMAFRNLHS